MNNENKLENKDKKGLPIGEENLVYLITLGMLMLFVIIILAMMR